MTEALEGRPVYVCPMHSGVRRPHPGACPTCGMELVPEGGPFALLRHIAGNSMHVLVMVALMVAGMVAAMLLMG
jgi:hypothetical protein